MSAVLVALATLAYAAPTPVALPTEGAACQVWRDALELAGEAPRGDLCADRPGVGVLAPPDVMERFPLMAGSCASNVLSPGLGKPAIWSGAVVTSEQVGTLRARFRESQCFPEVAWLPDVECSAVLVAPMVLLTAGHCAEADQVEFRFSATNRWSPASPVWSTHVRRVVRHPHEDLALLLLADDPGLAPAPWIGAIGLDWSDAALVGVGYGLQGHGSTALGEKAVSILRRADAFRKLSPEERGPCGPVSDAEPTCRPKTEFLADSMVEGVLGDSAPGDSGGPVYAQVPAGSAFQTRWLLVGVASRGRSDRPVLFGEGGIYVRPDSVADWMLYTIDTLHRTSIRPEE